MRLWYIAFVLVFIANVYAINDCVFDTAANEFICNPAIDELSLDINENIPVLPAGTSAVSPSFGSNPLVAENDLLLKGRGLDLKLSRIYSSQIYQKPEAGKLNLIKPNWLGYGWRLGMGRIIVPDYYCYAHPIINNEWLVEMPDGSIHRILEANKEYSTLTEKYILDDFSKVRFYNHNIPSSSTYAIITTPDGTKYHFSHWVSLGRPEQDGNCIKEDYATGSPLLWSDLSYTAESHGYVGIYLTKIEDVHGNYITIEYYNQTFRDPNDMTPSIYGFPRSQVFNYNDAAHIVSYGSPYIKRIVDTMGREITFHVNNPSSIYAKLDYIEYSGINGNMIINYTYSGELENNPYHCGCESLSGNEKNICTAVCRDDILLVKVTLQNSTDVLKTTEYEYSTYSRSLFKLTKIKTEDKGIIEYKYKDIPICFNNEIKLFNSLESYTVKPFENDDGYKFVYQYSSPDCMSWLRKTALLGPPDETGERSMIIDTYFGSVRGANSNFFGLDWRTGLHISREIWSTYNGIETMSGEPWDGELLKREEYYYKPIEIGKRSLYIFNDDLEKITTTWIKPVMNTIVKKYYDNEGGKIYATYSILDKYGLPIEIKDYGEINSAEKQYNCSSYYGYDPMLTCNLSGTMNIIDNKPDDNIVTEITYLRGDYEAQGIFSNKKEIKIYKNGTLVSHQINVYDTEPIRHYTPFIKGYDNYVHHKQDFFLSPLRADLNEVKKWDNLKNKFISEKYFYDDAGNMVEKHDPNGNVIYFYYTNTSYTYPYYIEGIQNPPNSCSDGVDNDGDGCIDEEEMYDPCNYGFGYEGVVNNYTAGGIIDERISSACDNRELDWLQDDPACSYGFEIKPCGQFQKKEPDDDSEDPDFPSETGSVDNFYHHAFLTRKQVYTKNGPMNIDMEYYPTGNLKDRIQTDPYASKYKEHYDYDDLQRLTAIYINDEPTPQKRIEYNDDEHYQIEYTKQSEGSYFNAVKTYYNLLGNEILKEKMDVDGSIIKIKTEYDSRGRRSKISREYKESPLFTLLTYTPHGKLKQIEAPNVDEVTQRKYGANWVLEIDENGTKLKTYYDAQGRPIRIIKALGTSSESAFEIEYDEFGKIKSIRDPDGKKVEYTFNSLGFLINETHPDSGTIKYEYDDAGNVIKKTNPDGASLYYIYDNLNRITSIIDDKGNKIIYNYDGPYSFGKVVSIEDPTGKRKFVYNNKNRVEKEIYIPKCGCSSGCPDINGDFYVTQTDYNMIHDFVDPIKNPNADFNGNQMRDNQDIKCFDALYNEYVNKKINCAENLLHCNEKEMEITYKYDDAGNIIEMKDFNGNVFEYSYDPLNRFSSLLFNGMLIASYDYTPRNTIKTVTYGNGLITNYDYEIRNIDLIKNITISKNGITLFSALYEYDSRNNLKKQTIDGVETQFLYDALSQLTGWQNKNNNVIYTYDLSGNRIAENKNGIEKTYIYEPDSNKLKKIIDNKGNVITFEYDKNGNLIKKITPTKTFEYSYDINNRLIKIASDGECVKYFYGPEGKRIRKEESKTNTITSYYYANGELLYEIKEHAAVSCNSVCGNGIIEEDEVCDVDNLGEKTCRDFSDNEHPYEHGKLKCSDDCKSFILDDCGYCGDGILQPDYEQCEKGQILDYSRSKILPDPASCHDYLKFYDIGKVYCITNTCMVWASECNCYDDNGEPMHNPGECIPKRDVEPIPKHE